MHNKIRHIFERRPSEKECIERLVEESPEFRAIFEDYEVCVKAFRHWSVSRAPEAAARVEEFRNIARELEEEVIEALITLKTRSMKRSTLRGGQRNSGLDPAEANFGLKTMNQPGEELEE